MSTELDVQSLVSPEWLHIPYQINGRSQQGTDCLGLVIQWYRAQGLEIADVNYQFKSGGIGHVTLERGLELLKKGGPLAESYGVYERWLQFKVISLGVPVVQFNHLADHDLIIFTAAPGAQYLGQIAICLQGRAMLGIDETRGSFIELLTLQHKQLFAVGIRFPQLVARNA